MNSFLSRIAAALLQALERVALSFESIGEAQRLLSRLGWDANVTAASLGLIQIQLASSDPFEAAEALFDQLQSGTGDELEIAAQLISSLMDIVGQIRTLVETPPGGLPAPLNQPSFWSDSIVDLIDLEIIDYLQSEAPFVLGLLSVFGLAEIQSATPTGAGRIPYERRVLHWENLPRLVSNPLGLLHDTYHWNDGTGFSYELAIASLQRFFRGVNLPARVQPLDGALANLYYAPGNPTLPTVTQLAIPIVTTASADRLQYSEFGVLVFPIPPKGGTNQAPVGLGLTPLVRGAVTDIPNDPDANFSLAISGGFSSEGAFTIEIRPAGVDLNITGAPVSVSASLVLSGQPATPWVPIGDRSSSRLEVSGVTAGLSITGPIPGFDVSVTVGVVGPAGSGSPGAKLVIDFSQSDGFLQDVVGDQPEEIDITGSIKWSSQTGISLNGQAQLQATISTHLSIAGVLTLDTIFLGLGAGTGGALEFDAAVSGSLTLGPIEATVDRIGVAALLTPLDNTQPPGNLDRLDLKFAFKPPNGLGIAVDAGLVTGGGYISFDPSKGQYAGILQLSLVDTIGITVIGVLDTIMPDGSSGFSFLLIITFTLPPIQLGFGFTLNGVGGLGGVNRTMNTDALQAGFRAHTLGAILFPPDPIDNAPQIISDIRNFFPVAEGRYLFGPLLELGWGTPTLITLTLGVLLEVPDPIRIAILGLIDAGLPTEDEALLELHIEILGIIDFGAKTLSIDGTLFDSSILVYALAGDLALRLSWGSNPNFLFSLGGFNPNFNTDGLDVPKLARLSVSLGSGSNPRISADSYFALTSNTVQFGANVQAYAAAGGFSIQGYLGYDVLIIISPFSFEFDFSASFDVAYDGHTLLGLNVNGTFQGPTPWHFHGDASISLLFFSVSASVDLTWGSSTQATIPSQPVLPDLFAAFQNPQSWSAALPPATTVGVSLATQKPSDQTLCVHPMGTLQVKETVVPLDLPITRYGNATPSDGTEFSIQSVQINAQTETIQTIQDYFAPGQFLNLSDADKLSKPSFEEMDAGVNIGSSAILNGQDSPRTVVYQEFYIYDPADFSHYSRPYFMPAHIHLALSAQGAGFASLVKNTGLQKYSSGQTTPAISVDEPQYVVTSVLDLSVRGDILSGSGTSYFQAQAALNSYLSTNPAEAGDLQIMPLHEVAA
ncbi:MAG: DUF6603 domain-containing protein [Candidatus Acidiferrales bacterium]